MIHGDNASLENEKSELSTFKILDGGKFVEWNVLIGYKVVFESLAMGKFEQFDDGYREREICSISIKKEEWR